MHLLKAVVRPFTWYLDFSGAFADNLWDRFFAVHHARRRRARLQRLGRTTQEQLVVCDQTLRVPEGSGQRVEARLSLARFGASTMPTQAELEALAVMDREDLEQRLLRDRISQLERREALKRRYANLQA